MPKELDEDIGQVDGREGTVSWTKWILAREEERRTVLSTNEIPQKLPDATMPRGLQDFSTKAPTTVEFNKHILSNEGGDHKTLQGSISFDGDSLR